MTDVATDDVMVREAPTWVRRLTGSVVLLVAAIAFTGSYFHMVSVGKELGEGWLSYLTPVVVDGLAIAASMVMLVRKRSGQPVGALARLTQLLALATSIGANVAAAEPALGARAWALIPPVFLFLAYELLLQQVRVVDTSAPAEATQRSPGPTGEFPAPPVRQVPHDHRIQAYIDEVVAEPVPAIPEHTGDAQPEYGPPEPVAEPAPMPRQRKPRPRPAGKGSAARTVLDRPMSKRAQELLPVARVVAKEAGGQLDRDSLAAGLRAKGERFGTEPLAQVLAELKNEGTVQ